MSTTYRIGIITAAVVFAGAEPSIEQRLKLLHILEPLSEEITWVATNCPNIEHRLPPKVTVLNIDFPYYLHLRHGEGPFLPRLFFFLRHQIKIMLALFKLRRRFDILVFAFGTDLYSFPMLLGKLLRKTMILRMDGRPSGVLEKYYEKPTKSKMALFRMVETVSYRLVDKLLPENKYMIDLYNWHRYQDKIADGSLYIDSPFLRRGKKLSERAYQIGYIGRFSKEKGVIEFTQSLSSLLQEEQAQAIMIGDGGLKDDVEQILIRGNIQDKVKLTGWIEHRELPHYLRDIKIVVVPSYREGLPNLVLEAMGCGCIVVATWVGGIPGVIKDGETGFIMGNNSPECIARNVVRALNHHDLDAIAKNARALMEKEYTFEAAVERYRNVLQARS